MVLKADQQRIRDLLSETIKLLCKNSLSFSSELSVEALIGVTLDQSDVFLINIKETIRSDPPATNAKHEDGASRRRSRLRASNGSEDIPFLHEEFDLLESQRKSFDSAKEHHCKLQQFNTALSEENDIIQPLLVTSASYAVNESCNINACTVSKNTSSTLKLKPAYDSTSLPSKRKRHGHSENVSHSERYSSAEQRFPTCASFQSPTYDNQRLSFESNVSSCNLGNSIVNGELIDHLHVPTSKENGNDCSNIPTVQNSEEIDAKFPGRLKKEPVSVVENEPSRKRQKGVTCDNSISDKRVAWDAGCSWMEEPSDNYSQIELVAESCVYVPTEVFHAAEQEQKGSRVVRCVARGLFSNAQLARSSCLGLSKTSLHGCLQQNKIDAIIAYTRARVPDMQESNVVRIINNLCCEARRKDGRHLQARHDAASVHELYATSQCTE